MALQSNFSSSSYGFTYDVFLNFRGSDTRFGFTGHLYKALCDSGIHTFIDDTELHRGDEISPSLIKAIEESMIYIPVLSINYASSIFCLEELVKIIKSFHSGHHHILPVFYDVHPSQVRSRTGSFGEAIDKHKEKGTSRVYEWNNALIQVANLSGYHWSRDGNKYEHEIIGMIVKEVSNKINPSLLYVPDYPVELEPHITQVHQLLDSQSGSSFYRWCLWSWRCGQNNTCTGSL
ncbi:putative TIR domain-containing protein [Medicago truncatula]|uniref:Putative TIR domain-containing protein n=1 Tax=Medicago truncatula TaxID=3880 RepID=A0A396HIE8_MEDTR|nr:toll/interleukin-1 receptor-like protein [Medicago truncatula]RHN52373.1 putative TIR domain-containing protein [Medicago truncatula]